LSTDRTFTRNYHVLNTDVTDTVSNIHLTGIGDRSYFDARVEYFQILTDLPHDSADDVGGLDCAGLAACNGKNPLLTLRPGIDKNSPGSIGRSADPFNTEKAKAQEVWNNQFDQARQATVAPVVDYDHIFADPILGGQLSLRSNVTALN